MIKWLSNSKKIESKPVKHIKASNNKNSRFYDAAKKNNLTADWSTQILSADTVLNSDLQTIRARSRVLEANSPYYKHWLRIQCRNVVGHSGIRLQMRVVDRINEDGTTEMDDVANNIIQENWKKWCKRENCSVNKRHDFVLIQRIVYKSVKRDGEIFVRKVKGFKNNPFMFALQLIESDHLDIEMNTSLDNGNYVRMGVELNEWGEVVAYHFIEKHPGEYIAGNYKQNKRIRLSSDEILHIYDPQRADQHRGIPEGVSSMIRLNQADGYEESELVASRAAACKGGFYTSPEGDSYVGDDSEYDEEGNETQIIKELHPGTFEELPEGVNFVPYDPQHPTTAFSSFIKTMLQGISSGLGISYSNLANDYEGVSFSSLKQANLNDRDGWKEDQQWFIEQLHMQVFPEWLLMALATKQLKPLLLSRYDKYNNASWRPRGWSWVDPVKESNANKINLEIGAESLTSIVTEQGRDIEEIFQERQKEKKLAEKYDILLYNQFECSDEIKEKNEDSEN